MAKTPKKAGVGKDETARRHFRARAVGDLLPDIGRASFRRFGFVQSSVVSRWREIVGDRYAEVSAPESIRFPPGRRSNGVLRLTVSGAHATMMQHIEPEIIDRVNRFFGYPAVARIAIQQGHPRESPASQPAAKRPAPPSLRPIPANLGASLREVEDPELRACLEGLAASVASSSNSQTFDDDNAPRQLQVKRLGDIGPGIQHGVSDK